MPPFTCQQASRTILKRTEKIHADSVYVMISDSSSMSHSLHNKKNAVAKYHKHVTMDVQIMNTYAHKLTRG